MKNRRVAITGIGIVSPFGIGREAARDAVIRGESGIRTIRSFDPALFSCTIAGEVPEPIAGAEQSVDRFTRLALIAAEEATSQSKLASAGYDRGRVGTLIGTGLGGCETLDAGFHRLYAKGLTRLPPTTIPSIMYNAATSAVSARFGAKGPALSTVSACASSAHAIGEATLWIRSGLADVVIAGGSDAPIVPGIVRAWEGLRVLAPAGADPGAACRPFSVDRAGLVLAEGAAVFVLEDFERAAGRGAGILGEIAGFGMSSDAGHITDPSSDGAVRAMRMAIESAEMAIEDFTYINAHGTGTRANDAAETAAIRLLFGSAADQIAVSSTKSMHGHAMGASGAIELAVSLLALERGMIPPTMNYTGGDPACDLDYVPNAARPGAVKAFLSNSFGFGGLNSVLAVRTASGARC